MKTIREIYNSLSKPDETVLFQVKRKSTLNKILNAFEKEIDSWVFWDAYREMPVKEIYLCVGKWRFGMAGIFPEGMIDKRGDYRFNNFCIDWKAPPLDQLDMAKKVDRFIDIVDRYRSDIKISRKKYEDMT